MLNLIFSSFVKGDTTSTAYIVIISFNKSHEYFSVASCNAIEKEPTPLKDGIIIKKA